MLPIGQCGCVKHRCPTMTVATPHALVAAMTIRFLHRGILHRGRTQVRQKKNFFCIHKEKTLQNWQIGQNLLGIFSRQCKTRRFSVFLYRQLPRTIHLRSRIRACWQIFLVIAHRTKVCQPAGTRTERHNALPGQSTRKEIYLGLFLRPLTPMRQHTAQISNRRPSRYAA
jgi:hypothetical protein